MPMDLAAGGSCKTLLHWRVRPQARVPARNGPRAASRPSLKCNPKMPTSTSTPRAEGRE